MRANASERECDEQGTRRAARLAGTPRLVLQSMAGLRAAGRAPRLPTSVSADAVANAKRAQYAPAYRCGGSTGWVGRCYVPPPVSRFTEGVAVGTINTCKSSNGFPNRSTALQRITRCPR